MERMGASFCLLVLAASAAAAQPRLGADLEAVLEKLPSGYAGRSGASVETETGELFEAPLLFEPRTRLRASWADLKCELGPTCGGSYSGWVYHFKFEDASAPGRMRPWLIAALRRNAGGELRFAWREDSVLVLRYRDWTGDVRDWFSRSSWELGYAEDSEIRCAEDGEQAAARVPAEIPPGGKAELPLRLSKELIVTRLRLMARAEERAPGKLSAELLLPGSDRAYPVLDESYDWGSEAWASVPPPAIGPSAGTWVLRIKNASAFSPARVLGWSVQAAGYSVASCGN